MKFLDVFNFRAAPAVNGLVIIADNKQMSGLTGQYSDPGILDSVGILKLIDQDL